MAYGLKEEGSDLRGVFAAISACTLVTSPALAIDVEPGDYVPLPAGTNLLAIYYQHIESDSFSLDGVEITDSELSADIGVVQYSHYLDFLGRPAALQAYLPIGAISNASVGGGDLQQSDGLGDLTIGATIWPIAAPMGDLYGTTVGFSLYTAFPTGKYDVGAAQLGDGGIVITPQVGLVQGLGRGLFFEANYDVSFTQDFNSNGLDVSVEPLHQVQVWLRQHLSQETYLSVGYSGLRGGEVFAGGVATGEKNETDEVRFAVGHFINPTTEISGRVGYAFRTKDGYANEPVVQLRFVKLF